MMSRRIHQDFPLSSTVAYMNCATVGPMPLPVVRKLVAALEEYHARGPGVPGADEEVRTKTAECRQRLADVLGTDRQEVALMESTMAGLNAALLSLAWAPGDEVITTDIEHPAARVAIRYLQFRCWVRPVVVCARDGNVTADQIESAITPRTRAILISHVSCCTGARLPVEEIARSIAGRDITLIVDGAQGAGALELGVRELGCHFYAFPGYKWLLGPEGTAGLFVRRDVAAVSLTVQPGLRGAIRVESDGRYELAPDARRFELSTVSFHNFAALADSVEYLGEIGIGRIADHSGALAALLKRRLASIGRVRVITPVSPSESAGLVVFSIDGHEDPDVAVNWLYREKGILTRGLRQQSAVRASPHLFNTEEEVERLAAAVREFAVRG
jgi:selenocysteine lyase/cysteine desulfurase